MTKLAALGLLTFVVIILYLAHRFCAEPTTSLDQRKGKR